MKNRHLHMHFRNGRFKCNDSIVMLNAIKDKSEPLYVLNLLYGLFMILYNMSDKRQTEVVKSIYHQNVLFRIMGVPVLVLKILDFYVACSMQDKSYGILYIGLI